MFSVLIRLSTVVLVALAVSCAPSPTLTPVPTATPVPPTATAIPLTSTPMPPTATATRVPVTAPHLAPAGIQGNAASGAKLFSQNKIECDSCHDVAKPFPGGEYAPNLLNIVARADQVIKSAAYTGKAKTVAEYFRESILAPNIYLVPGDEYREKDGTSGMAQHDYANDLEPQQVEDLVAYLLTLGKPISSTATITSTGALKGDPVAGAKWFIDPKVGGCDSCHDNSKSFPGGEYAPNLGNIATEAERVIKLPNYTGKAKTVAEYFRESILTPNVYLVPGDNYREKDGKSAMEQRFAEFLTPQQVEDLIAYLLTLK